MMSQLPRFQCFFCGWEQRKRHQNGIAVTSLGSFLFHDNFTSVIFKRAAQDLSQSSLINNISKSIQIKTRLIAKSNWPAYSHSHCLNNTY